MTPDTVYGEVASLYDSLVGDAAFENWKVVFERLSKIFHLEIGTCADIACGTGQVLGYLAERGARVYGVDLSRQMLEIAGRRTAGTGVTLLRQDMRRLRLPEKVDLVTCNTDSLNYLLDEDDLRRTLRGFGDSLKPGGYALFDMNTAFQLKGQQDGTIWKMREANVRMYWRSGYDEASDTAILEMRHVIESPAGNRLYLEVHRERSYRHEVVEGLLCEAGFTDVFAWDAAGLGAVCEGTRRIVFLAGKGRK